MNKLLEMGIIKTVPRRWTKEDIEKITLLRKQGLSAKEISTLLDRSEISVSIKLKRLTKTNDSYNEKHRADKYEWNTEFLEEIHPGTVLDVYAGNSFYKDKVGYLYSNDIDIKFNTTSNIDAFKLLCLLNYQGQKFDIVDLDPYGSAIAEFDLAIRIATKGIVITLGEMGHRRWKRLDFVKKWYGIDRIEDLTTQNLITELTKIAARHSKKITPIYIREYSRISRVWFKIEEIKTYEQWGITVGN
jgi:hypothetical protein